MASGCSSTCDGPAASRGSDFSAVAQSIRESRYTVRLISERDQSMSQPSKLSPYRWIIEILLLLLLTAQSFAWLAPAPILQEIRNGLGISLSSAGPDHLDHRALHRHLLAAGRRRRRAHRRTARVDYRNLADGDRTGRQRLRSEFRRAARMPRARGRRLRARDRAARHAHDAMVRRRRMAVHQHGQLRLRLRRTHRGIPRDAGAVRRRRLVADDAAVVRRRLGGRRAVVDNLRPRASRRDRRASTGRDRSARRARNRADGSREDAQRAPGRGRAVRRDVGVPDLHRVPARVLPHLPRHVDGGSLADDAGAAVHRPVRGAGRRNRHGDVGIAQTVHVASRVRDAGRMRRRD